MTPIADMIRRMAAKGLGIEAIAHAVEAIEIVNEEKQALRREQNRKAQQNQRARQHDRADGADKKKEGFPHLPKKEKLISLELRSSSLELRSSASWPKDFKELFWKAYPRKVGKLAVLNKLEAVRQRGDVGFDQILAAIARIDASEPKFIPHPATWLNQGRYLDGDPAETDAARNYRELQRKTEEYRSKVYGEKPADAIRNAVDGSGTQSADQDNVTVFPQGKILL